MCIYSYIQYINLIHHCSIMQCNTYHRWVFQGTMVNQWGSYETDDLTYAPNGNGNVLKLYSFENFDKFDSFWIMGATLFQV